MNEKFKKTVKVEVKKLKDGDVSVTVKLLGFNPTIISSMANDIHVRSRSALGRTIGNEIANELVGAYMPKEDKDA